MRDEISSSIIEEKISTEKVNAEKIMEEGIMELDNMIGKDFPSLGKRVLYSYIATYPKYQEVTALPGESQKQMYDFMKQVLATLYEHPELVTPVEEPDDCYHGWALANTKPELNLAMEKIENKFATLIESLIKVGKAGEVSETAGIQSMIIPKGNMTVSKVLREKLEAFGLNVEQKKDGTVLTSTKYPKLFTAWSMYGKQDDEGAQKITRTISFIHQRYFGRVYRATDFFELFLKDSERGVTAATNLEKFFEEKGFTLSNFDINNKTRFAYVKWLKEYPNKEIASMRAYFNWKKEQQLIFEFKIPGFRLLLNQYDDMDEEMQRFIFHHLKTCDGCGYCTQTDKSGKRERLAASRTCDGQTMMKCPLYPWFTWTDLADLDMKLLLRLFELAEEYMQK